MKVNYTLIHYLSNGSDYCRGCHMGSSSSDFGIFFFDNEDELINKYAELLVDELLVDEHFEKDVFGCHEYTVLVNGVDRDNSYNEEEDETDPLFDRIIDAVNSKSKTLIAAKQIQLDEAAKQKAKKDEKLEKERIKREIAYLQSKL